MRERGELTRDGFAYRVSRRAEWRKSIGLTVWWAFWTGLPVLGIEVSDLQLWAKLLALAILALVIIGLVAGLGGTADELRSMVDPDGVTFRIDKDGVYTGGAHPTLITWPTIRDVELADFVDANSSADTDIVAPFSRVTFTTTGPTIQRKTPGDLSAIETIVRRYAPTATVRRTFNVR